MNNWVIKEDEQLSSEIILKTVNVELITKKIEKINLETNERTLLDKPRQSLVIRGFDSGECVELTITGDFKVEEKHIIPQAVINNNDDFYYNYE